MSQIAQEHLKWQMERMSPEVQELWLAAQQGDAEAQFKLGKVLQSGKGIWLDGKEATYWSQYEKEAIHWFQKAAEQGYAEAQVDLAYVYLDQKRNFTQALYWLRQAAEQEDVVTELTSMWGYCHESPQNKARKKLGDIYQYGEYGVTRDYKQALLWFTKAAQQQDIVAQYWLGQIYFEQLDFETAQAYFQTVCQNSHEGDYDELDITKIQSLAKDKLTLLQKHFQEQEKQRKIEAAKEVANKQMLSFLTHALGNTLSVAPEMVRQTIRLLSDQYQKDTAHYKAINNIISLFATFSIIENLLQTFKQCTIEPEIFQLSWQTDNQGENAIDLIIAFALRQTISQIFFQHSKKLAELLPSDVDINLKQLRQSFIDEIVTLELNPQNAEQVFTWIKQNFDIFTLTIANTQHLHFEPNKTRFTILFSIFSEIIFNALKYSNGQNPIKLIWAQEADSYSFTCSNTFNPDLRYQEQGSQKGLFFINKLMTMLKDSRLEHNEVDNQFTIKLIFSKTNFEAN